MANTLKPDPSDHARQVRAIGVRDTATWRRKRLPDDINPPVHKTNGEIAKFQGQVPSTFTKGLPHDEFGLVDVNAFAKFVKFINQPRTRKLQFRYSDPDGKNIDLGPGPLGYNDKGVKVRTWESPLAGHVYSLQGADADMLTMPPAPALGSGELSVEMAEVYALALLRNEPFTEIVKGSGRSGKVTDALKGFSWFTTNLSDKRANARRKARLDENGDLTAAVAFRGSTAGAKKGPYLSQFMLIGNASRGRGNNGDAMDAEALFSSSVSSHAANVCPILIENSVTGKLETARAKHGYIVYGTQVIDQRTSAHLPWTLDDDKQPTDIPADYLTDWASWIDAQNGANFKDRDMFAPKKRFITTPRDLCSYVHFDQLYQAYLNACLILLTYKYPSDSGLPEGNGHPVRDAFATFGGPHILSLVTEVATRALKFARRQKFNIHLRARPEAIAGVLTLAAHDDYAEKLDIKAQRAAKDALKEFENAAAAPGSHDLLSMVSEQNAKINGGKSSNPKDWINSDQNYLLPMAFPEGSPMHPSYAAGHATVAGACVTILKAFFEMFNDPDKPRKIRHTDGADPHWVERRFLSIYGDLKDPKKSEKEKLAGIEETIGLGKDKLTTGIFAPTPDGEKLMQQHEKENMTLTVLGELDKLAANISIGRDMAGVHYYTDYYESLRMGERLAVSILEEQMLTYPEKVSMRFLSFDGDRMIIEGSGDGENVDVKVYEPKADGNFKPIDYKHWFER